MKDIEDDSSGRLEKLKTEYIPNKLKYENNSKLIKKFLKLNFVLTRIF